MKRMRRLYKPVFVLCGILFASPLAAAPLRSATLGDAIGPIEVNWNQLTLKASLPQPFGEVLLVVKQAKDKVAQKITAITIIVRGHKIKFNHALLKGLIMVDDPEISYRSTDLKNGELSAFHVFFKYGFPLRGTSACGSPGCFAYRTADFIIDNSYQVKRKNNMLPVR